MTETSSNVVRDVIVIGSGAGGGPLACRLAEAGLDVVLLEKGPAYQREDYLHDELAMQTSQGFFVPQPETDPHVAVRRGGEPRKSYLGWIASCHGGGTAHMGGFLYRFHPDDFRMVSRFGPYAELADWPIGYEELEPYYCQAEWEVGVSGATGSNRHEGPRSCPYPMAPLKAHPLSEVLEDAAEELSLEMFPTPRSINSRPYGDRPACQYCQYCSGYGCPVGARGTVQEALLRRATASGHCEIRSPAMAHRITVDETGRANGCLYFDDRDRERRLEARIVVVACSAVESARLLLLSSSPEHPEGLANSNGLVGQYLQFHGATLGEARFEKSQHPELPLDDPHPFLGRSSMDHYFLPDGVSDLPKGGLLRFGLPNPNPIATAQFQAHGSGRSVWGQTLKDRICGYYRRLREVDFEVFHDYIPNAGTYMELDPEAKDRWGLPAARIHYDVDEHLQKAGEYLVEKGLAVFEAMGADSCQSRGVGAVATFLVQGSCRMGDDPERSVLDRSCQTHEVPNLFVVDGSFMPTSGGAPPTLTILANSFRVADHILERGRRGEL